MNKILTTTIAALLAVTNSHAALLYWDTNSLTLGSSGGTTAAGAWNGTNAFWNDLADGGAGNFTATTTSADDLVISAGTNATGNYTITLTGTQVGNSLALEEGGVTFASGTLGIGAGGITGTTTAATVINSAFSVDASQTWNLAGTLTIGGSFTPGANTVTIASGTAIFTNGTGAVGTGGITVGGGWLQVGNNSFLGAGNIITLNSGKLSSSNTSARTVTNALTIAGNVTIGDSVANGSMTLSGATTLSGASVVTLGGGTVTLGALSFTAGSATTFGGGSTLNLTNGLNLNGGASTLTINSTATNTLSGAISGTAGTLVLAGSSATTTVGALTGANASAVEIDAPTGGVFNFNNTGGNYSGGTTLKNGTLLLGAGSTLTAGAHVSSPVGTGTLTLAGGNIRPSSSNQTLNNSVAITGDFTFNQGGLGSNLTLNPTAITSPGPGTITLNGARTITTWGGSLVLTGPVTGASSPSLAVRGPGIVSVANVGTASTYGNVTIGQAATSGSLGGRFDADTQNALGSGAVEVRYGGTLNMTGFGGAGTNAITVRKGGFAFFSTPAGNPAHAGAVTIENGATLGGFGSNNVTINLATATVPSAGALNFAIANSGSSRPVTFNGGTWPSFTGTMAFGGANSGAFTLSNNVTLSSVADSARTFAFNGLGRVVFTNGVTLNADLTIKGAGNTGLGGAFAGQDGASLGTLSSTGGARALNIVMAPGGMVSAFNSSPFTGTVEITSGTLFVTSPGSAGGARVFPNTPNIVLDGGAFRSINNTNAATTATDPFVVKSGGGSIEHFQANNGIVATTFSGAITPDAGGAGALTLRYGGVAGSPGALTISGDNSTFASGFVLRTTNGRGKVQFTGVNSTGAAGNAITVGDGITFGFDSAATMNATLSKFTTTAGSVLSLTNMATTALDLSASGLNRDLWLGSGGGGTVNFNAALTPFATTYKFAPAENVLAITGANVLTAANNVLVAPPVLASGAYASSSTGAAGHLQLNASQDYSGTTTVSGVVANAHAIGSAAVFGNRLDVGTGGRITSTSSLLIEKGGLVTVTGTAASPATIDTANLPVTVHSTGTLRIGATGASDNNGVTNRLPATTALTLGGAGAGGGTLTLAFPLAANTHAQTIASLALAPGANALNTVNTPAGTLNLAITAASGGGVTRSAGGVLNITPAAGFAPSFTNAPTSAGGSAVSGTSAPIVVGYFNNNADFVAAAAGTFAAPTYTAQSNAASWAADQNITNTGTTSFSGTIPGGGLTINSLRNNSPTAAGTITIGAGDTLTVASGMILNVGAQPITFTGGNLTSGNGADLIFHNSPNTITVNSAVTGSIAVTKLGANAVRLTAAGGNTFAGINALAGTLEIASANAWGNPAPINIMGGTIRYTSTTHTLGAGYPINVGAAGGAFVNGNTTTFTVQSPITLNGALNLQTGSGTSGGDGTLALTGNITGPGALQFGAGGSTNARYRVQLTGNNSAWTGGIQTNTSGGGAALLNLFVPNPNAIGTGPIVTGRGMNLYFDTNAAGAVTFPNNMSLAANTVLSFWGQGPGINNGPGTAPATLTGDIYANGGLTFQGIGPSEIILAGTLSVLGTGSTNANGQPFNYGTATAPQNFVNGPGGIGLGVTALNTTTTTSANGTRVEAPDGSTVAGGAAGFVRFQGKNSFIPGAAGPGYIAALSRPANADDTYGFLLGGNGDTYRLPEGKSFLIGNLGGSGGETGVIGVAGGGTATLLGSPKITGFLAGDVNIHGNTASDTAEIYLHARTTADRFVIGDATTPVVFTQTTGDSGASTAITLLAQRGEDTALVINGGGTVEIINAEFTTVGGTADDDRGSFEFIVQPGATLAYNQDDAGLTDFAFAEISGTLSGSGKLNTAAVNVLTGGAIAPGNSIGTLGIDAALAFNVGSALNVEVGTTTSDSIALTGTGSFIGTGNITLGITLTADPTDFSNFILINNDGADAFTLGTARFAYAGTPLNDGDTFTATTGMFTQQFQIDYTYNGGGDGNFNDVALLAVPEPGSAALLLGGLAMLAARRRRK